MGTAPAEQPAPSTPSAPQSTPATQGATTTPTPSSATPPGADSGWPPGAKEAAQAAGAAAQKARQEGKTLPEVCDPSTKAYWERADIKAWAEANPELAKRLKEKEGFRDSPPSTRTQELEKIPNNGGASPAWARRAAEVAALPEGKQTLGSLTITRTPVPATSPTGGAQTAASHNVTVSMGTETAQFSVGPDGKISGVTGAVAEVNSGIEKQNKERASSAQGPAQPQTGGQPASTQDRAERLIRALGARTASSSVESVVPFRQGADTSKFAVLETTRTNPYPEGQGALIGDAVGFVIGRPRGINTPASFALGFDAKGSLVSARVGDEVLNPADPKNREKIYAAYRNVYEGSQKPS